MATKSASTSSAPVATAAPVVAPVVSSAPAEVSAPVADISQQRAESVLEASAPTIHDVVVQQQGLTEVSEAELRGESEDSTGEQSANPEPSEKSKEPEENEEANQAILDKVKADKVPKGFVPLAAVHEVRGENKYLKEQIASLSAKIESLSKTAVNVAPPTAEPSEFESFEQLSDSEFLELASDSPSEALLYMNKLNKFQEFTRQKAESERAVQSQQEYLASIYEKTNLQMEEVVPGIFDPESPTASEFRDFAVDLGFTEDMFYLTNPATRVILPGETEPLLLGDQAADFIKLLANAKTKLASTQSVDVNAIRAELRKEIEADIMSKIKSNTPFRSISDIPSSNNDRPEFTGKMLSSDEFARLSEKEQELYLAGE